VSVEPKVDMKKRLGFSPDNGDTFAIMLDLCRNRFGFLAGGMSTGQNAEEDEWQKQVALASNIYENVDYAEQIAV
jgi:hypothetical protein